MWATDMLPLNPIKYLRFAARLVRYSRKVGAQTDLSLLTQGREAFQLLRRNQLELKEYYETYELYRSDLSWEEKQRFLSRNQFAIVDRLLNPKGSIGVLNKFIFKVFAERYGLPVPEWYGVFDSGFGITADGEPLCSVEDLERLLARPGLNSLIFKPICANKAMGIFACVRREGKLLILDGGETNAAAIHARMSNTHHGGFRYVKDSWMIERRVRQHPWLDRFSEDFVHNYRIVTFLTEQGEVELVGTGMGIGMPDTYVHKSGLAALSAGINDEGILRAAVRGGPQGIEYFERHPVTGAQIAGEKAPDFEESVAVAFRAHRLLPHLRLLGWDIAATDQGPVIFEGNSYWNWEKLQRGNRSGAIRKSLAVELPRILSG